MDAQGRRRRIFDNQLLTTRPINNPYYQLTMGLSASFERYTYNFLAVLLGYFMLPQSDPILLQNIQKVSLFCKAL